MSFPVVGIGASAGGLESFSDLLARVPASTGMAYVFVQHLDPGHGSLLVEILSKKTALPVEEARDGMKIYPDHLYVIPPNTTLTLNNEMLQIRSRDPAERPHSPVDIFFHSLAEQKGANAIGIILSGTGSDGAKGIQAIKESGGITFAQDESSARFYGMPRTAIQTGCVDFVLVPGEIAQELVRISRHPYLCGTSGIDGSEGQYENGLALLGEEDQYKKIFRLLTSSSGVDFTHYKRSTIQRRLTRRMALHQKETLVDYVGLLQRDPAEIQALFHDLLIRVTSFFRDPEIFDGLTQIIFPTLLEARAPQEPLRIWIPGCASGEEVYSVAICLTEFLTDRAGVPPIQIFGTDVSSPAIETARAGSYLESIAAEVSPARLSRFFVKVNDRFQIAKSIRDLCVFAKHDITHDPPFSRIDLISCRNVLIYLDQALQRQVFSLFHYALKPDGFLVLGPSEALGQNADFFALFEKQHRVYTRKVVPGQIAITFGPGEPFVPRQVGIRPIEPNPTLLDRDRILKETDRLLLARYSPACVLVDEDLNILQFRGPTSRYLEHPPGPASLNLQKLARSSLLVTLLLTISKARTEGAPVRQEGIRIEVQDEVREAQIEVIPFRPPQTEVRCYLILFEESRRGKPSRRDQGLLRGFRATFLAKQSWTRAISSEKQKTDAEIAQLKRELEATRLFLQSTIEEQEAGKEELKSAHEEVLSANEEFQSTNEELETAKEELQSANEELVTTNDELRSRNRDLNELNDALAASRDYSEAVLATIREPLLVLDKGLRVLKANRAFYQFFKTRPEDTVNHALDDLGEKEWNIPELVERLRKVLPGGVSLEEYEFKSNFPIIGERWVSLNARRIAGARERADMILLAIEDVTDRRVAENAARAAQERSLYTKALAAGEERFKVLADTAPMLLWMTGAEGKAEFVNSEYQKFTGRPMESLLGEGWAELVHPDDVRSYLEDYHQAVKERKRFEAELRFLRADGEYRWMKSIGVPRFHADGAFAGYVGCTADVHDSAEADRRKDQFLATLSHEVRTPLNAISGWTYLLRTTNPSQETLVEGLQVIERNVRVQTHLIDDLLDISRIAAGQLRLEKKIVDFNVVVRSALDTVRNAAEAAQVRLSETADQSDLELPVFGDQGRLQQVVWNVLSNAVKYTPAGGRIDVKLRRLDSQVELIVSDTGRGISPEFLPKLFHRFSQADATSTRTFKGLGIGLAIARQLVELHDGSIHAQSSGLGNGATFTIVLPLASQEPVVSADSPLEAQRDLPLPAALSVDLTGISVVAVDDDAATREFLRRLLNHCKAFVTVVGNVDDALLSNRGNKAPGGTVRHRNARARWLRPYSSSARARPRSWRRRARDSSYGVCPKCRSCANFSGGFSTAYS